MRRHLKPQPVEMMIDHRGVGISKLLNCLPRILTRLYDVFEVPCELVAVGGWMSIPLNGRLEAEFSRVNQFRFEIPLAQ